MILHLGRGFGRLGTSDSFVTLFELRNRLPGLLRVTSGVLAALSGLDRKSSKPFDLHHGGRRAYGLRGQWCADDWRREEGIDTKSALAQ